MRVLNDATLLQWDVILTWITIGLMVAFHSRSFAGTLGASSGVSGLGEPGAWLFDSKASVEGQQILRITLVSP